MSTSETTKRPSNHRYVFPGAGSRVGAAPSLNGRGDAGGRGSTGATAVANRAGDAAECAGTIYGLHLTVLGYILSTYRAPVCAATHRRESARRPAEILRPQVSCPRSAYSWRKATMGSTRLARRAG